LLWRRSPLSIKECGKLLPSAYLRRRELIKLLGGSAAAWPLTAQAQQPERLRLVGVLMAYAESARVALITSKFSAGDRIHRPHLQRCEAWQTIGASADKLRAIYQS
jgi:hypothetical protein